MIKSVSGSVKSVASIYKTPIGRPIIDKAIITAPIIRCTFNNQRVLIFLAKILIIIALIYFFFS